MAERFVPEGEVDLTNCDREPIHIPGAILPHGAMLVVDEKSFEILQVAGDTGGLLGRKSQDLMQRPMRDLVTPEQFERLTTIASASGLTKPRHLLDPVLRVVQDRPVDVSIHRSGDTLVLEFEDADPADPHAIDPLACVQDMLDSLEHCETLHELCQAAAERVRKVMGYDRVMVYRFQPDDSGCVLAEARGDNLEPFLGLHYPASDIPRQARALYLKSWLRLITAVDYEPAPLQPTLNPRTGEPLDMSQATLRDVSAVHREYLRNMGVAASMSISIVVEGRLWGLIACHHYQPKRLPRHLRAICELFGAMFSLKLEARDRALQLEARLKSRGMLQEIIAGLTDHDDYGEGLFTQAGALLTYVDAAGLAFRVRDRGGLAIKVNNGINCAGRTPNQDQISALTDWLAARMDGCNGVFETDRLSELWPPAKDFANIGSGLLALSISVEPRDFILWFRPEVIETVHWAGDPSKPVQVGEDGARLTPRKSFQTWTQEVRERATPWAPKDSDAAVDLRLSLLDIVLRRIDAAARERERALQHEQLLMSELDHRVKNTLANIQALVAQTSRSATSLTEFTLGLEQRIRAMSKAHGLLTEGRWVGASIADVAAQEFAQHRNDQSIVVDGPTIILTAKASLALSLTLHELSTNAAKYGALSNADGRLELRWRPLADGGVRINWVERDGPPVKPPARHGFGSTLIERALPLETGGSAELRYESAGLECEIVLPAATIVEVKDEAPQPGSEAAQPAQSELIVPSNQRRRRILVVEDSALVIMTVEMMLEDLGWELVGPATRVDEALKLIASADIDAALLDVNLDGEMSWPVAELLRSRGVPFAFTTGYDGHTILPENLADAPVVGKPFKAIDITRCLFNLVETKDALAN